MTNKELTQLASALELLEIKELIANGYQRISGGFAIAEMFDFDDNIIDIELKFGIQSDCENTVHTEQLKMDRKTFKLID